MFSPGVPIPGRRHAGSYAKESQKPQNKLEAGIVNPFPAEESGSEYRKQFQELEPRQAAVRGCQRLSIAFLS